jgi:hypothetical protein
LLDTDRRDFVPSPRIIDDCRFDAGNARMLPANARFSDRPGGYIYRRYQRTGDPTLDESYFPILWSRSGQRTTWIENYCSSGLRRAA